MIAFFRKFRQRFLAENHLGKYPLYALGEVLLVMVGILLALRVDNRNEERKERRDELELLKALKKKDTFRNFLSILITVRADNIGCSLRAKAAAELLMGHIDNELRSRQKS
jgi:hypothetical protein